MQVCSMCELPKIYQQSKLPTCKSARCNAFKICDHAWNTNMFAELASYVDVTGPAVARYVLERRLTELTINDMYYDKKVYVFSLCILKIRSVPIIHGKLVIHIISNIFESACNVRNPYAVRIFLTNFTLHDLFELLPPEFYKSISVILALSFITSDGEKHRIKLFNRIMLFAGFVFKPECKSCISCVSCNKYRKECSNIKKSLSDTISAVITILGLYKIRCPHNLQKDTLSIIAKCMWEQRFIE